jgi:predicted nucleotidyltransferase
MQLGWSINDLNDELEVLFGKSVDLVSKKTLRPALKAEVLDQAQVIYAA